MSSPRLVNLRPYARFIPGEEIGACRHWQFTAVDAADRAERAERAPVVEIPVETDDAAQQALLHQAQAQARAEGLAQGLAQAAIEGQRLLDEYIAEQGREAAGRLQALLQALDAGLCAAQQQMAQQVLDLACGIARQVLRRELERDPQALLPVLREALGLLLADGRPASVRLNPGDLQALDLQVLRDGSAPSVQWLADASLPAGGCLVESAGAVLDASLSKRWQRALAALGVDDAPWQEDKDAGDER